MNVEELLHDKGIPFTSAGKDILIRCLNPDHADYHPSMRVDKITGVMGCFSCGFGGNIFSHFNESVDLLGIKVLQLKNKIEKLKNKGLTMPVGREKFRRDHRGIKASTYTHFDAFMSDAYEDRIVFPIHDITGRLVALLGRYAFSDAEPKYLIDPPGVNLPIFPAHPEIHKESVVIVEGIFDVLNLYDKGLTNVVCIFGKSMGETRKTHKREENLQKFIPLKIQGVKKVYILLDSGASSSAKKLANLLEPLFLTQVVEFDLFNKEKDAGNLTKEEVETLKEVIYESSSS